MGRDELRGALTRIRQLPGKHMEKGAAQGINVRAMIGVATHFELFGAAYWKLAYISPVRVSVLVWSTALAIPKSAR
ncbi:hypothetical protein GCM10027262_01730 [Nocardia tengchongensis]